MTSDRLSDEATGLPPLCDVEPNHALLTLAWCASEALVTSPITGTVEPCRVISLRGLQRAPGSGEPEWGQVHIAVPVEVALDVAAALAKGTTDEL